MSIVRGFLNLSGYRFVSYSQVRRGKSKQRLSLALNASALFFSIKTVFHPFFQVSGISFAFDPKKPSGQRVEPKFAKIGDEYIDKDKKYHMVTKAYLVRNTE